MKKVLLIIGLIGLFSLVGCSKNESQTDGSKDGESSAIVSESSENIESTQSGTEDLTDENQDDAIEETIIIKDENFDFNANFDEALKASATGADGVRTTAEKEEVKLPDPVYNLNGVFNWKKNLITLTWDEPEDPELTQIEIRNNKSKDVIIVPKGKKTYSFTPKGKSAHKYILTTCDSEGLKGPNVGCSVEDAYLFTSFTAPTVSNTGYGKTVTAEIKGINFDKYGIEEKDFRLFSPSNSSISNKSKVKRIDSETLSATMTIPKKPGNYVIVVSCGDVKLSGYFTVQDYSSYSLGKVIYNNKKPESIIAGYDSLGYPFGLAIKEQGSLKWAMEGTFGYDYCFTEIVSEPDVVGVNSAINAKFSGDIDGIDNWNIIVETDENCKKSDGSLNMNYIKKSYPAFYYALNYGEGWYIPSISELCQIYKNKEYLNKVLSEIGGKRLKDEFYWSSSQNDYSNYNACAVKFVNGAIYKYYKKGNAVSVRCIKLYK